jgi:Ran GTPase-activating protein (RanGAP) involved in mRNA processing and transport
VAPALYQLFVRDRDDVARILEFLFHIHGYLRKLILQCCWLGENSTSILAFIVAFYPDLEGLALVQCDLTSDACRLLPCLKKMSELNLSDCMVQYVC